MLNLLPKISEKVTKVEESKLAYWIPSAADPAKAVISNTLQREFTIDVELLYKPKENVLPKSEPNYVPFPEVERLGPSQISGENRGVPDDALISTKVFVDARKEELASKPRPPKLITDESAKVLKVKIYNYMKNRVLDLFLQCNQSRLVNYSLRPFQEHTRVLDGHPSSSTPATIIPTGNSNGNTATISPRRAQEEKDGEWLYFFSASTTRATITTTNRQQVKDYRFFANLRIGLEVEWLNDRLVVSNVLPETQAAAHEKYLDGAEIIAINGERVIDLEEFQSAMSRGKKGAFITLTIAAFKEGRQKIDELYLQNVNKSNQMKSLFSNLMGSIEDERKQSSNRRSMLFDDDEEEEEQEEKKSKGDTPSHRRGSASSAKSPHSSRSDGGQRLSTPGESSSRRANRKSDVKDSATAVVSGTERKYFLDDDEGKIAKMQETAPLFIDNAPPSEFIGIEDENSNGMIAGKKQIERHDLLSDESLHIPSAISIPKKEEDDDDDNSSHEDWNALTKIEPEEKVFPFTSLVCMPSARLAASKHWGIPKYYLQFSNFSAQFKMEVYWIDEEGVLIPRGARDLVQGDTHFELFSAAHVWAVIATPTKSLLQGGAGAGLGSKASVSTSLLVNRSSLDTSSAGNVFGNENSLATMSGHIPSSTTVGSLVSAQSLAESNQMIFVFRPSKACCLQESKCLSILWSPGNALTVSHLLYSKSTKSSRASQNPHKEDRIKPSIHIQLFETKSSFSPSYPPPPPPAPATPGQTEILNANPALTLRAESNDYDDQMKNLGKLSRKPLRTTRSLSKIRK